MSESEIHFNKLFNQLIVIQSIMYVVDRTKLLAFIDIYVWLVSSTIVALAVVLYYLLVCSCYSSFG